MIKRNVLLCLLPYRPPLPGPFRFSPLPDLVAVKPFLAPTPALAVAGLALVVIAVPTGGTAQEPPEFSLGQRLARLLSPELRKADQRIDELRHQLSQTPRPNQGQFSAPLGYHSPTFFESDDPSWVQIDLGRSRTFDSVALVPAYVRSPLYQDDGYGFPVRFRVEASDEEDFRNAAVLADYSKEDFPNPGNSPVLIESPGTQARYLRVTSVHHYRTLEHWTWALGEVLILSGNYNIALYQPVDASHPAFYPPAWTQRYLTDGLSLLGPPSLREQSPTNGYLSASESKQNVSKWVQIDLGKSRPIDEVRLIPSRPTDFADTPGMGFPPRLTVSVSNDPRGYDATPLLSYVDQDFRNPGNDPVILRAKGHRARYVRVTAHRLWNRGQINAFSLAELQVYSKGTNIAFGQPVQAKDRDEDPNAQRWAPEFLVDGFTSQYQLTEIPDYLRRLDQRRGLETELRNLFGERRNLETEALTNGAIAAGGVFVVLTGFLTAALIHAGIARRRQNRQLRRQIARDLHDDIGSNLASIALISQLGSREPPEPLQAQSDLGEIHNIAESTSRSMRDILWMIDGEKTSLSDLVQQMREAARTLLGSLDYTIEVDASHGDTPLSLPFRRHVLLAFKESLNNAAKHAGASRIRIRIQSTQKSFQFSVCDDGCGFDIKHRSLGHGLNNLQQRASSLGGRCQIDSAAEAGTTVSFACPVA